MNDKKELEALFDFNENEKGTTEKVVREAQNRSLTRIIGISMAVWIGALALLGILMMQISPLLLEKHTRDASIYHKLHGANLHFWEWQEDYKIWGSTATAGRYKVISDVVVPIDVIKEPAKNWSRPNEIQMSNGVSYTEFGVRMMQFFHPEAVYTTYLQELEAMTAYEDTQIIEMALSFDQAYTREEVEALVGNDLKINWGWIDETESYDEHIYSAYDVMGMHFLDDQGSAFENPEEKFIQRLEMGIYNGAENKERFEEIEQNLSGDDGEVTPEDIRLIGCVVTGTKEALEELVGSTWIKASSIGTVLP